MADVRELLARLNPTTIRYDIGKGGGTPELTNVDIAGALGFVPAGLGREVLECCYLDTSIRASRKLQEYVLAAVREEWNRQGSALSEAKTDLALGQAMAQFARGASPDLRREIDRAQARLDAARASYWPKDTAQMLPVLIQAVLLEISGAIPHSERARAEAIGRSQPTYRQSWSSVYGWLLQLVSDAEMQAGHDLWHALRSDKAA